MSSFEHDTLSTAGVGATPSKIEGSVSSSFDAFHKTSDLLYENKEIPFEYIPVYLRRGLSFELGYFVGWLFVV